MKKILPQQIKFLLKISKSQIILTTKKGINNGN